METYELTRNFLHGRYVEGKYNQKLKGTTRTIKNEIKTYQKENKVICINNSAR